MKKNSAQPWFRPSRGVWYVTLEGKQINLGPDKAAAFEEFARLISERRHRPAHRSSGQTLPTVIDAFLEWLKPRRSDATYEWYRYRLERLARRYPTINATQLTSAMVEDWVDEYSLSVTSRRNYYRAAKKCLKWARSRGLIKRNRIRDLEVPSGESREIVVSAEDYRDLLANIRNQALRDLVVTSWETGCRPQESLRVEARHVDLANQRWVFPKSESKNRRISRVVYLTDTAAEITARLVKENPSGKLFRNTQGRPWNPEAVNCAIDLVRIRIGIRIMQERGVTVPEEEIIAFAKTLAPTCRIDGKKVKKTERMRYIEAQRKLRYRLASKLAPRCSLYALRHTWATNALQKGVDPLTTAILMGHSDPSMLSKVYQHVALNPVHMLNQAKKAAMSDVG